MTKKSIHIWISNIIEKCIQVWHNLLLTTFSRISLSRREEYLKQLCGNDYEVSEVAPITDYDKVYLQAKANEMTIRYAVFTSIITFFTMLPSGIVWVIVLAVIDFLQTQMFTLRLTQRLQYIYIPQSELENQNSLFDARKSGSAMWRLVLMIVGFLIRQGLKYGARILIVKIFLLNIVRQVLKYLELCAVSQANVEDGMIFLVTIASALVAMVVAWLLFYPMMKTYLKELEEKYNIGG